jgi:hypothetical protein
LLEQQCVSRAQRSTTSAFTRVCTALAVLQWQAEPIAGALHCIRDTSRGHSYGKRAVSVSGEF